MCDWSQCGMVLYGRHVGSAEFICARVRGGGGVHAWAWRGESVSAWGWTASSCRIVSSSLLLLLLRGSSSFVLLGAMPPPHRCGGGWGEGHMGGICS